MTTEAEAVAQIAVAGANPTVVDPAKVYTVAVPDGVEVDPLDLEEFLPRPRRVSGTVTLQDVPSFVAYYRQHDAAWAQHDGDGEPPAGDTFLYASREAAEVVSVFNDDAAPGSAGWRDHRAVLKLRHTPEWLHWTKASGDLLAQEQFAEHIEAGLAEIRKPEDEPHMPDAAEMLEVAQKFRATTKSEFGQSHRLATGQREFTYTEEVSARAGQKGSLPVPELFVLGIPPWPGCEPYRVEARLRYQIREGRLSIGYALVRPHEVLDAAFTDVTDQLTKETGGTVLRGTPAGPRA